MQQQGAGTSGGGGGSQSQYGDLTQAQAPVTAPALSVMAPDQNLTVEVASPISSRPPATSNLEELMRLSSAAVTAGGEDEAGGSSGNRWPRQETLALLKIRSDMDAVFRDATIKGPLWEDVSRKMTELGYKKRSGKKCKEKFENVHKYYKRTKEGRGARQDGKTYKFFTELEALHNTTPSSATGPPPPQPTLDVAPVSVGLPMPIPHQPVFHPPAATISIPAAAPPPVNMSFSSDTNSASHESSDYDDMDEDEMASGSRKRKRESSGKMMEFFESLMKQVMQKQERMQKMFLEAIEKREQDRMIREEAWKRQETVRLQREHDLMAQERANSASRDAAILSFIHKFTGQTIQLPTVTAPIPPPAAAPPPPPQVVTSPQPPSRPPRQQSQIQRQYVQPPNQTPPPPPVSSGIVVAIPEQQIAPPPPTEDIGGSEAASSSRWPKAEVLALINLRSGLENRYQESGPKGPLWEEISGGMLGLGYRRNAKRCKEKWENINKYYKKVKESSKKRPEDSKTCPYFHQLDALYQRKIIGGPTVTTQPPMLPIIPPSQQQQQQHQENVNLNQQPPSNVDTVPPPSSEIDNKNGGTSNVAGPGSLFGEGTTTNKPEAVVKELIMGQQQQGMEHMRSVLMDDENEEMDSYDMDEDEEDEDDELEGNDNSNKMGNYKIEYQRPNTTSNSNAGPNSFLAMVQ